MLVRFNKAVFSMKKDTSEVPNLGEFSHTWVARAYVYTVEGSEPVYIEADHVTKIEQFAEYQGCCRITTMCGDFEDTVVVTGEIDDIASRVMEFQREHTDET